MTTFDSPVATGKKPSPPSAQRGTFRPIIPLAVIGGIYLLVEIYVLTKWITGPNFKPTPVGPSPVPTYMQVCLTALTIIGIVMWFYCIWHFLIKPWRRERRITVDGYFALCFIFIYWLDPMGDMIVPQFTYNAWLTNMGSWLADTPGVIMPNAQNIPEPYLLTGPLYLWCIFGVAVVANRLMKKVQNRFPQLSNFQLIMLTVAAFIVWDLFWELTFIRIGYWTYPTTPAFGTIFGDHWYRIHLTEPIAWGTAWASFAIVRYFRDDKGRTIADKGLDQLHVNDKGKVVMRFLSLYGVLSIAFTVFYIMPTNAIAIHGDNWPEDTLSRSYFTNYICGDGTGYACPGQGVPIPRPKSAHVNPNGETVPGEVPVPPNVPFGR